MVERVCSIATLSDSPVHRGFIQLKGMCVFKLTFTIFKRLKTLPSSSMLVDLKHIETILVFDLF